ncbi:P-II family nitrogen regulator [Enterococcus cecorum]|uniref:P-II family nitrogen regulator n=1 Tax=Enterococcus cecorum TaxID=44008 RepID=UPI000ABB337A|nr:P-II family nitrogen regulator [Enterococcus cecorum]MCJ0535639.1 P-II family nitrogen regulator [Enterococcus cecorum]MCJ0555252.1 P-II family nitrogen regulator [Enterococcus cecorum]CAI3506419.1 P-II family nitrogen regulator [Enterococcus cecorum]CAI3509573.1 P-II family nitrogen regulator [Enterococcus cecorum]
MQEIYFIVNCGLGSKLLKKAKKLGMRGGTILRAHGTIENSLLHLFALDDQRKEIVMMAGPSTLCREVMQKLAQIFHFEKPNHGIAFSLPLFKVCGVSCYPDQEYPKESEQSAMYQSILTIVNRGKAEDVITAANHAGAKGGTIIHGRGAGIHETSKLFAMEIEPEKEVVLILAKSNQAKDIIQAIRTELEIDKPGNGIILVQEVLETYGIYE